MAGEMNLPNIGGEPHAMVPVWPDRMLGWPNSLDFYLRPFARGMAFVLGLWACIMVMGILG